MLNSTLFLKSPSSPCVENSLIIMVCLLFIQKYTLISSQWPMIMAYYDTIKHCFAIGKGFSTVYFSWNNQILNFKINTYFQHLDLKPTHPLTAQNCFFFGATKVRGSLRYGYFRYPNYPNSTRAYYFTPAIFTAWSNWFWRVREINWVHFIKLKCQKKNFHITKL